MPEKADGSIIISAEVDDKRAQSQLNALEKKVKKLQNSIEDMQSRRSPLVEQMQAYGAELDKAKAKLAELKYMQAQDAEVLSGKTPIGDGSEFMRAKARQSALALSAPQIRAYELKYHGHEQHEPQRAREGRVSSRKTAEAESTAPDKIDAQRTAEQEQALAHR